MRGGAGAVAQFVRFCLIGGLNTAVSYVSYYLLIRAGLPMGVAYALSYVVGMITSLLLNARWTFTVRQLHWTMAVKFALANLLVASLGEALLYPVVYVGHVPVVYAQLVTLVPTTILNFWLNKRWVFRAPHWVTREVRG